MSKQARWVGLGMAGLGAILFSGKAIIVKLAYRYGVDTETLLALRMLYALPFFGFFAFWTQRSSTGHQDLGLPDYAAIFGVGLLGYYLASYFDFLGLQYISVGLERVILYLNPTLVVLLGVVFWGRRLALREVVGLAIAYVGVVAVFVHDLGPSSKAGTEASVWVGAAWVLASAISYALYLSYSGQLVLKVGTVRLTSYASIVACAACLVQFVVVRGALWPQVPAAVHGLSFLNATLCTVLPVFLVMFGIARLGSATAAQVGMIGPVATLFLGWALLDESVSLLQLLGTGVVLMGVTILTFRAPKP